MKSATRVPFVVLLFALLLMGVSSVVAQDQLNLNDGLYNNAFLGPGSPHIILLMESQNCPGFPTGTVCYIASSTATGSGPHLGGSSGTYTISAAATGCSTSLPVGCAGPFHLTVNADGSSTVTQTAPIMLSYTSVQGTLEGTIQLTSVTKTDSHLHSIATGTFIATGGTFAEYFANNGSVSLVFGLTFPLQDLFSFKGFSTLEIQSGTIVASTACGGTLPLRWKRYEQGLPRVVPRRLDDLNASFSQTNNPSQIPCSGSSPCGSIDVSLGTDSFDGDLVVTVQLTGPGTDFQFDRMGFNSDLSSGFALDCFAFGTSCSSGVGGASLGGSMQEDGFGRFDNTLFTGLNGGSGCSSDGTGCQNLFTFVIANSNGALQLSDFDTYVAGHIANGSCSGFIATPSD